MEVRKADDISSDDPGKEPASKADLAQERTDWAQERTILANERNLSSWFRTAIGSVAAGLGIGKLLGTFNWPLVTTSIGIMLVCSAAIISAVAFRRYYAMYDMLKEEGLAVTSRWLMGVLMLFLLAIVLLAFILLLYPS